HVEGADVAAVGETVRDLAAHRDLVVLDDLPGLAAGFVEAGLGIALGRQGPVALGALGLEALAIDLLGLVRRRGALALALLFLHGPGELALPGQPGLEQLVLQGIAHGSVDAGAGFECSRARRRPSARNGVSRTCVAA